MGISNCWFLSLSTCGVPRMSGRAKSRPSTAPTLYMPKLNTYLHKNIRNAQIYMGSLRRISLVGAHDADGKCPARFIALSNCAAVCPLLLFCVDKQSETSHGQWMTMRREPRNCSFTQIIEEILVMLCLWKNLVHCSQIPSTVLNLVQWLHSLWISKNRHILLENLENFGPVFLHNFDMAKTAIAGHHSLSAC